MKQISSKKTKNGTRSRLFGAGAIVLCLVCTMLSIDQLNGNAFAETTSSPENTAMPFKRGLGFWPSSYQQEFVITPLRE